MSGYGGCCAPRDWRSTASSPWSSGSSTGGTDLKPASEVIWLEDLGLAAAGRKSYSASPWGTLKRILPESEVGPEDVFIDFGSGMGRVVFEAAHYPFKRVIAPELTRIARETIDRHRERLRCRQIELLTADPLDYEIADDVTMAYFYDPLEGAAFERVIEGLIASADRNPRRLRIVYLVPRESERLESTGRIRFVRNWRRGFLLWRPKDGARLYEIDPPGRSG